MYPYSLDITNNGPFESMKKILSNIGVGMLPLGFLAYYVHNIYNEKMVIRPFCQQFKKGDSILGFQDIAKLYGFTARHDPRKPIVEIGSWNSVCRVSYKGQIITGAHVSNYLFCCEFTAPAASIPMSSTSNFPQ